MSEYLKSDEHYDARIFLLQTAQMESYSDVLEAFCLKKSLPKSNPLSKFDVSMNSDHLLTASGRVRDCNFPLSPHSYVVCCCFPKLFSHSTLYLYTPCNI